jgi:hypothetical protein
MKMAKGMKKEDQDLRGRFLQKLFNRHHHGVQIPQNSSPILQSLPSRQRGILNT